MEAMFDPARVEDLRAFERQYYDEINQSSPSNQTKFNYAWCLIKSAHRRDIAKGIVLLEELSERGDTEAKRDYLFYLAVGLTKMKDYDRALECVKTFLRVEPQNRQAQELLKMIEAERKKDALKGAAITVGTISVVTGVAIGLASAFLRK